MAQDHRIEENGQRLSYTCANRGYRTNVHLNTSYAHRDASHPDRPGSDNLGSVFDRPLAQDGESLWLEHVVDNEGHPCYWLMWYDPSGVPKLPASGILSRENIADMQRLFASFIP